MSYPITDILDWAEAAQPLAAIGEYKNSALKGGSFDLDLHTKIYIERNSLQYAYEQDPTDDDTYLIGNWVLALLGAYLFGAQNASGSGGSTASPSIPGVVESPIQIRGDDFASALSWQGTNGQSIPILATYTLQVFYNPSSIFLIEGVDWTRTVTGFDITLGGVFSSFDATAGNASDIFMIFISP